MVAIADHQATVARATVDFSPLMQQLCGVGQKSGVREWAHGRMTVRLTSFERKERKNSPH
jgi:hypothetical protein